MKGLEGLAPAAAGPGGIAALKELPGPGEASGNRLTDMRIRRQEMTPGNWQGMALIRIASLYLMASLLLGLYMAITHNHVFVSVHSHIGILGWATMALAGIAYLVVPGLAATRLAVAHFWLHNLGLPPMVAGLFALIQTGNMSFEPIVAAGSVLVLVSLLLFTINVWVWARTGSPASVDRPSPVVR